MTEKNYSKRELDQKFQDVSDNSTVNSKSIMELIARNDGDYRSSLARIEMKQDHTNGTVTWLTKMIWLAMGFCACLSVVMLPLIFALVQSNKL
jgi:hypothetical protein